MTTQTTIENRVVCIPERSIELAKTYACQILDHARRGDYGGTLRQVRTDLSDLLSTWVWDAAQETHVLRYHRPDGTMAESLDDVVHPWAGVRFIDIPQCLSRRADGYYTELSPAQRVCVHD